jgi:hypothetical protein
MSSGGSLVLVLVLAAAAGCADECLTAESRCDGDAVVSCVQTDGFLGDHWGDEEDCGDGAVCVDVVGPLGSRRSATCASSDEPDPRCPAMHIGYFFSCAGPDTLLRCSAGYSLEIPCDLACINSSDGVHGFCAR